ncbi:MAG: hypothetical protein Alpg2KO_26810 [Alphaproteobacteria bacterium]
MDKNAPQGSDRLTAFFRRDPIRAWTGTFALALVAAGLIATQVDLKPFSDAKPPAAASYDIEINQDFGYTNVSMQGTVTGFVDSAMTLDGVELNAIAVDFDWGFIRAHELKLLENRDKMESIVKGSIAKVVAEHDLASIVDDTAGFEKALSIQLVKDYASTAEAGGSHDGRAVVQNINLTHMDISDELKDRLGSRWDDAVEQMAETGPSTYVVTENVSAYTSDLVQVPAQTITLNYDAHEGALADRMAHDQSRAKWLAERAYRDYMATVPAASFMKDPDALIAVATARAKLALQEGNVQVTGLTIEKSADSPSFNHYVELAEDAEQAKQNLEDAKAALEQAMLEHEQMHKPGKP